MEAYFLSLKFLGALISDPIHYLDAHRLRPLELERLAIGRIEVHSLADFDGDPHMRAAVMTPCEDFLLFLWKRRKVKGLRCLKESLLPSGGVLTRFSGRFWGPVSGGCFRTSGIFAPPRLRPVLNERRLGSHGPW